jgi:hypothetical protein
MFPNPRIRSEEGDVDTRQRIDRNREQEMEVFGIRLCLI